jgi:hypothetical protein
MLTDQILQAEDHMLLYSNISKVIWKFHEFYRIWNTWEKCKFVTRNYYMDTEQGDLINWNLNRIQMVLMMVYKTQFLDFVHHPEF